MQDNASRFDNAGSYVKISVQSVFLIDISDFGGSQLYTLQSLLERRE